MDQYTHPDAPVKAETPPPVFLRILLGKLWPNPDQPRKYKKPGAVEGKMRSMKAIGQKTPIKVWRLSEAEKAAIALTLGGPCPYEFGVIGGHLRLEAALRLGWATLDALVYDLSPAQVLLEAFMDNEDEEPHWLDRCQGIYDIHRANQSPNQQATADLIGTDQPTVSQAIQLIELLDLKGKEIIYGNPIKSPDSYEIRGSVAYALTGLEGAARTTPEARELMTRALAVAQKRRFTEAMARKLVEHVIQGGQPEDYLLKAGPETRKPKEKAGPKAVPQASPQAVASHSIATEAENAGKAPEPEPARLGQASAEVSQEKLDPLDGLILGRRLSLAERQVVWSAGHMALEKYWGAKPDWIRVYKGTLTHFIMERRVQEAFEEGKHLNLWEIVVFFFNKMGVWRRKTGRARRPIPLKDIPAYLAASRTFLKELLVPPPEEEPEEDGFGADSSANS
jgi:hypothetical protein